MQCEVCQKELKNPHKNDKGVILCRKHFDNWLLAKKQLEKRLRPNEVKPRIRNNQYTKNKVSTNFRKYFMTSYDIQVWLNQNPYWKGYYEKLREKTKQKLSMS